MKMVEYYRGVHFHAQNTDVTVDSVGHSVVTVTGLGKTVTYHPTWNDNGVPKMTFVFNC